MGLYARPTDLREALEALAQRPLTVLAGGTDHYPARVGRHVDEDILDITALDGLREIAETDEGWRIGATATWTDIIEAELPACFDGLKQAARQVGGQQIQNQATIAGNLCNASPAADGVPPLLSLDADVELASASGMRRLPLADFIEGNRRTARRGDELLTAVIVPKENADCRSGFFKLGARRYLVISIVMVAGTLSVDRDGRVVRARIAVGACSDRARRLTHLEDALSGLQATADLANALEAGHLDVLSPIDDVRGTAAYRIDAATTLVRRMLRHLTEAPA